jgi:hypothetical protein
MNSYYENLKGAHKVLYKTAYEFHMKYHEEATLESAHQAGIEKLSKIAKLSEELNKPQVYVNVATGERYYATEAELMAKHQF